MYNFIKGFEGAYNWAGGREAGREGLISGVLITRTKNAF